MKNFSNMQACWADVSSELKCPDEPAPKIYTPCPLAAELIVRNIREIVLCRIMGYSGMGNIKNKFVECYEVLNDEVARALPELSAEDVDKCYTAKFLSAIPDIQREVEADAQAAYDGDPSINDILEVATSIPSITAILHYRIARRMLLLGIPLLPRYLCYKAYCETGIDIHPGAQIGRSLFLDHGSGIVIGETARVGDRVRIYQGVTLGSRSFPQDKDGKLLKGLQRHPVVGNNVVIYAGATILGRICIGDNSVIGGNVWVTRSVAPNTRIAQPPYLKSEFAEGSGI